jgi:ABC-type transporter Mla subunit MlaD
MRRHKPRVSRLAAGMIAILVILAACYLVFGGSLPFSSSPFVLKAVFTSNTELHIPSPVRIAGADVGEVTSVSYIPHSRDAATVIMDINKNGLPIHADATVLIRSRIFLEERPRTPARIRSSRALRGDSR